MPSDGVLRNKLIYFVLQRMMFWSPADDVLLPPIGSMLSDGWKGCFHWVETSLLMSGNKEPDTLMTPLTPFSRGCKPSVYRHYGTLTPLNYKSRACAREKQNVSNLSCRFFVDLSNRITNSSTYGKRIANSPELRITI